MKSTILQTLAYADIFDYPLKKQEIWQWLIVESTKRRAHSAKFEETLLGLLKKKLIQTNNEFYFLPGRERTVQLRKQRENYSRQKIKKAERTVRILAIIPWVKLIGLTGSLARRNAEKEDDIDLFFIVAQDRLWLTRGLVVFLLSILGVYRRPEKVTDMICPNMFVSERDLKMSPSDLYTAYEVCSLVPIFIRGDVYFKFFQANSWAKEFLPNVQKKDIKTQRYKKVKRKKGFSTIFLSQFLNILEKFSRNFQLWYMAKRRTTEVVSRDLIKFHPQDARTRILKEFQGRILKLENSGQIC